MVLLENGNGNQQGSNINSTGNINVSIPSTTYGTSDTPQESPEHHNRSDAFFP